MKIIGFLICLAFLLLTGCMDTFLLKDYDSKSEFYKDINNKVEGRTVDLELNNGLRYTTENITIEEDSTYVLFPRMFNIQEGKTFIPNSDIEYIEYESYKITRQVNKAQIFLNNGKVIHVQNFISAGDSVEVLNAFEEIEQEYEKKAFPTQDVKSISFNNRLKGMLEYSGIGIISGLFIAYYSDSNRPAVSMGDPGAGLGLLAVFGTIVGFLGGGSLGLIPGSPQDIIITDAPKINGWTTIGFSWGINSNSFSSSLDNLQGTIDNSIIDYTFGPYADYGLSKYFGIRAEILYDNKCGSYQTNSNDPQIATYLETVRIASLEMPVLFQVKIPDIYIHPRFYAGPAISIFLRGRSDRGYTEHVGFNIPGSSSDINLKDLTSPYLGYILGGGFNINRNLTFDVQYYKSINSLGNNLFDARALNLRQSTLTFKLGYELSL
jgi:hypothetical protein